MKFNTICLSSVYKRALILKCAIYVFLEVVEGESEEDREARSLLNKFLGAQVLLQGMEPLISAQSPGLVSQVERQRLVISTSSSGKVCVTVIYITNKTFL
jgi:hypothetical protein